MENAFQVFQCTQKTFHAFPFQLCSTANSKFSLHISLCEINCIKIQIMSLVLNLSILWCPEKSLRGKAPLKIPPQKKFPPGKLPPRKIARRKNAPPEKYPPEKRPPKKCLPEKYPPEKCSR